MFFANTALQLRVNSLHVSDMHTGQVYEIDDVEFLQSR